MTEREKRITSMNVRLARRRSNAARTGAAAALLALALGIARDVGSFEAGKRADLVVLAASPLADIADTRQILYVIFGGRALRPGDLLGDPR